jgi:hypothetical protein
VKPTGNNSSPFELIVIDLSFDESELTNGTSPKNTASSGVSTPDVKISIQFGHLIFES